MKRLFISLIILIFSAPWAEAGISAPKKLKDLYFGEALYYAYQGDWFDAIVRLDVELAQHYRVDEPERDTLQYNINQAEFDSGDFELDYRMHQRGGRAMTRVIEGNVAEPVRNEAIFRLAKILFQTDRPKNALYAIERIRGSVPPKIRDDVEFMRAEVLMSNGRYVEAVRILRNLQDAKGLEGFADYNLAIALINEGKKPQGLKYLDRAGRINGNDELTLAIRDKANLLLGTRLLKKKDFEGARQAFDRVRLNGPFSNRALLYSGWADAFQGRFERALVPWSILANRETTDASVQEAMLAVPYAYAKLDVYGKAAVLYDSALKKFGAEMDKLDSSIKSIREGNFLRDLARAELKQDSDWVVKLRQLPQAPETYYLLDLMASNDFQESLKNYLDLEELHRRLETWDVDLDAFQELIRERRAYYQPLLPVIDQEFRRLDSQMRLRLEQRDRIGQRLKAMLVVPRPDYLATSEERAVSRQISLLEHKLTDGGEAVPPDFAARIKRLRGVLYWNIHTDYDRRLTEAYKHFYELNKKVEWLKKQYGSFVRARQAATLSYEGYDGVIRSQQVLIRKARERVDELLASQGHMLETMAINELTARRKRLAVLQIKARFAIADSYDRATRAQSEKVDK